ncbi:nucleoside hydrolase [Mariniluteicoccus endophyticus]
MTRRLVADVDTGIDDAIALAWLCGRDDVDLVAVTTSAGNTTAAEAAANSAGVLELCGRGDVPVVVGTPAPVQVPLVVTPETHGPSGLGYAHLPEVPAGRVRPDGFLDTWLDAFRSAPGEVDLLVTGPLTNLAVALRAEPRLPDLVGRVTIMGGAFEHPGNTTPTAEWNTWVDPHAAAEVYEAWTGRPEPTLPVVCALETTESIELRPADLDALAAARGVRAPGLRPDGPRDLPPSDTGDAVVDLLADALRFYFEFHDDYGYGYLAQVHDLFAAMVALDAVDVSTMTTWVGVETTSELTRGTTVRDRRRLLGHAPNARVVTGVDPAAVRAELTERLSPR